MLIQRGSRSTCLVAACLPSSIPLEMALPPLDDAVIQDALSSIDSPYLNELVSSGALVPVLASTAAHTSPTARQLDARLTVAGGFECVLGLASKDFDFGLIVARAGPLLSALAPTTMHGAGSAYLADVGAGPLLTLTALRVAKKSGIVFAVKGLELDIKRPVPIPGVLVYHAEFIDGPKIFRNPENADKIDTKGFIVTLDSWVDWRRKIVQGQKVDVEKPLVTARSVNPRAKRLTGLAGDSKL